MKRITKTQYLKTMHVLTLVKIHKVNYTGSQLFQYKQNLNTHFLSQSKIQTLSISNKACNATNKNDTSTDNTNNATKNSTKNATNNTTGSTYRTFKNRVPNDPLIANIQKNRRAPRWILYCMPLSVAFFIYCINTTMKFQADVRDGKSGCTNCARQKAIAEEIYFNKKDMNQYKSHSMGINK